MQPKNKLNLFSFTMIVIGLVIGMGIFRTAADSAEASKVPSVYFSAWIIGGIIAICGALTFAEIGSRYPVTGGYYKVFSQVYHPSIAFAINCLILISNAASLAGVALIGSEYFSILFPTPLSAFGKAASSILLILFFFFINLQGLRTSSRTQNFLMIVKISLILVIILALFFPDKYQAVPAVVKQSQFNSTDWIKCLGLALVSVSFTYGGYQQTINFGQDIEQPSKNMPKGIFIGMIVIILLYLLANLSYYHIIGFSELQAKPLNENDVKEAIAYKLVDKVFGHSSSLIFSGLLILGVMAYVNGLLLSNPRVMYAMGSDGSLPKIFAKQDARTGVLNFSLTIFTMICVIILLLTQKFDEIITFSMFLDCFGMILSSATIFWFRRKTKHLNNEGIFKMKLFPLFPLIFILAYLFVWCSIIIEEPMPALTGTALLIVFLVMYFIIDRFKRKENVLLS